MKHGISIWGQVAVGHSVVTAGFKCTSVYYTVTSGPVGTAAHHKVIQVDSVSGNYQLIVAELESYSDLS